MQNADRSILLLALILGVAGGIAAPGPAFAQADPFTLIALPDTQFYTCTSGGSCASGNGTYDAQTDWIDTNRDVLDIRFVTQLGDCVQNGNVTAEFDIADLAYQTLEAATGAGYPDGIPFGIAVGNHDQFPIADPGSIPTVNDVNHPDQETTTTTYNSYFGLDRFCPASICRSYYGDHFGTNNDNHYALFSANGYDFIILHIEYMPSDTALRQAVIDWADGVLGSYPNHRAIVSSHHVLGTGSPATFSNQGSALYEGLKANPNLFLILGGHIAGEGQRTDTFNGNTVHSLLSDYQDRANGGDGWLRILEFQPANNLISVETYSPTLALYETDADSEFTLAYDMGGGYPGASTVSFQQGASGYSGTVDTYIEVSTGSHGTEEKFFWDGSPEKYALLRFEDLFDTNGGPIPAGAFITSATLHYVADDNGNDADVHHVTIPWADTVDYAGFGTNPGAQSDEDYDSSSIGQASGLAPGDTRTEHTLDVTASLTAWSADPSSNQGWIFVYTGASGVGVRSSEYVADPLDRPRLSVSYLANPCTMDSECDDGMVCTSDVCGGSGFCENTAIAGCCEDDADCADANVCTTDSCNLGTNMCENTVDPGCCVSDVECDDADACTADACVQPNAAALVLDGTGDWVSFGNASTHTELGLDEFTLETWFRQTGAGDTVSTGTGGVVGVPLIAKGRGEADGDNRDANYFLGISGSVLAADFEDTGGSPNNHPVTGSTSITSGVWTHAAVTFDGSTLQLYLNGSPDGSISTSAVPRFDSIQPFSIGTAMTSTNSPDGAFQGELDEVRVWNRARTQMEIQDAMFTPIASDPDLVGRWSMDEGTGSTAFDSINANDGTLVGDATWTSSGLVSMGTGACQNTADPSCCSVDEDCADADACTPGVCHAVPSTGTLDFDGANDYVTKGEPSTLGSNTFTIEGWIYWGGGGATASSGSGGVVGYPIIAKGLGEADDAINGTNLDANYFLAIDSTTLTLAADFEATADSSNHPITGTTVVTTEVWHHVAATYDGTSWGLYLDGNLEGTSSPGVTPRGDSIQHFGIGAAFSSTGTPSGAFDGLVHDVRVWDHARSQMELVADMENTILSATGLLGSFPLDEGSGTTATDATGNGNDGTISGASWTMAADTCTTGPSTCEMAMFQEGVDGYAGTVDTYIEVSTGAHGTEDHLFWDGSPEKFALLRFEDLFDSEGGPVPDSSMIVSAELSYVVDDDGNDGDVHEVLIDWIDTVDYAGFGVSSGAQAGVDYDASALADQAPGTLVGGSTLYTIDVTSSVTAWIGDPSSNRGWIVVPTGGSGVGIRSSEHATSDDRPKLKIRYLPEPSLGLLFGSAALGLMALARRRRGSA